MKKWLLILMILVCVPVTANGAAGAGENPTGAVPPAVTEYVLHAGDILSINVYGYPDLSFPTMGHPEGLTIRPDGKITYPFLGEVTAQGMTARELTKYLTERLGELYVNPTVSVNVLRMGTDRVYVLGEVNMPGSYELDKSRTLLDAIGAARGWTKDAAKTKVFVIRANQKGTSPMKVNLLALLKEGDMSRNIPLQQGDVVYLTGNNRIDFAKDIVPLVNAAYMITWISNRNND